MSDERVEEINKRIDKEIAGAIGLAGQPGGAMLLAPKSLTELMEFSKLMSVSGACIRPQFRGNPGACLAILMQALKWNADPWAVANKAYAVKNARTGEETIAYEAQLLHSIVNTFAPLQRRLKATYSGSGQTRACLVSGLLKGEEEPSEYQSPTIAQIAVKNSPLWTADPDQQLWYYSTRAWARRHVPEILLGIYTPEELRGEVIDLEPTISRPGVRAAWTDGETEAQPRMGGFATEPAPPPPPRPEDFATAPPPEPETKEEVDTPPPPPEIIALIDHEGVVYEHTAPAEAYAQLTELLINAASISSGTLDGVWESNDVGREMLGQLTPSLVELPDGATVAQSLARLYNELSEPPPSPEAPEEPVEASMAEAGGEATEPAPPPRRRGRPPRQSGPLVMEPPPHVTEAPEAEEPPPPPPPPPREDHSDVLFPNPGLSTSVYYARVIAFLRDKRAHRWPKEKWLLFKPMNEKDLMPIYKDLKGQWGRTLDDIVATGIAQK